MRKASAALLAALCWPCLVGFAFAQDATRLRIAMVPAIPALAVWVAQDEGFFTARHLDVTLTPVQNIGLIPNALGKQFDIGMATPVDFIKAAAGGVSVVAVAANHFETDQTMTNALVVRKGAGIRGVKDFPGKTVATSSIGAILQVAVLHWLKKDGIEPMTVRFVEVPFPNMSEQMEAGRIDAAIAAEPFGARMVAAGNISLGDVLLQVTDPSLATLWVADRSWAQANRPAIAQWTAALEQSARFIAEQPKEARDILAKETRLPPQIIEHVTLPHFETRLQPQDLRAWIAVLAELGQLRKPVDPAGFIATAQ